MSLKKNLIILVILGTLCLWLWTHSGSVVKTYKIGAVVEKFIPDFLFRKSATKEDSEWENTWNDYLKSYGEDEEDE